MDINYELYRVFYYVAASLSFSEASKQLFISQSAVSQSVKVLEKKLGLTLFNRSTKRVQLTPEGEILLRYVEPAVHLIQRGEAQLMESGTLGGGQLRIGASDTICRYFLIPYLSQFHKSFPNVHIKVTNQTSTKCVDLLESGQVDLIVTTKQKAYLQMNEDAVKVLEAIEDRGGLLPFDDKASPEIINQELGLSKAAFKRAVGHLLKEKKIRLQEGTLVRLT